MVTPEQLRKLIRQMALMQKGDANSVLLASLVEILKDKVTTIKGDPGEPGDPGYTPIKGKDYFTDQEIFEMARAIEARIRIPKDGDTPQAGKDYPTRSQLEDFIRNQVALIKLPQPKDGRTPVKGVDYYTPAEQDGLVARVKNEFPDLTGKEIIEKINDSSGYIDASRIKNLPTLVQRLPSISLLGGPSGHSAIEVWKDSTPISLNARKFVFTGSGVSASIGGDGVVQISISGSGAGGGHTIQDEGVDQTQRTNLNFVGDGVTVTDDAGNDATKVTISGGGGTWGSITGTLSDQTDLQSALDALVPYTGATTDLDLGTNNFLIGGFSSLGGGNILLDQNGAGLFLIGQSGGVNAVLDINSLTTSDKTFTFPNASGTLALTSDLDAYVPYTGAGASVDLGANGLALADLYSNTAWGTGADLPGTIVTSGDKSALFWNPKKGAFWAGEWTVALSASDVGDSSAAFGINNFARGQNTFVAGYNNDVDGQFSAALGRQNTTASTSQSSFAAGYNNDIFGYASVALGLNNIIGNSQGNILIGNSNTTGDGTSDTYIMGFSNEIEENCYDNIIIGDSSLIGEAGGNHATGVVSIGSSNTAEGSIGAGYLLGTYLKITDDQAIVIGSGAGFFSRLTNNETKTLYIGFDSTIPSIRVSKTALSLFNQTGGKAVILDTTNITTSDKTVAFQNVSGTLYVTGGVDVSLADGGTGASLADPNADRIMFWDDSAGAVDWLAPNTGLSISGTNLNVNVADLTTQGIVELATAAETTAGTDATRAVTPDGLAGSTIFGVKAISVQVIDGATSLTTGDGKVYIRVPASLNGMNIVGVAAQVIVKSTSGTPTVQIARGRQASATSDFTYVDTLSTAITIDANEYDSKDASSGAVINASNDDLATGDVLRIDVDVAGTGTKGLQVTIECQLP